MKLRNIVADVIIVILCVGSFALLKLSGIISIILMLLIGFGLHCAVYAFLALKNREYDEVMVQMNSILAGNEANYDEYMEKLKKFKNKRPEYDDVISEFIYRSKAFEKKEEALKELIAINGDKAKAFLTDRSKAARDFMYANLKKFVMSIIVYDATSKRNRADTIDEDEGVQEVLKNINEMTDLYDKLLKEVTKMNNDFDFNDPGLNDVIENLQELRLGLDHSNNQIHLFVTPTKKNNISMVGH